MSNEQACFILGKIVKSPFFRSFCLSLTFATTLRVPFAFMTTLWHPMWMSSSSASLRNALQKKKKKQKWQMKRTEIRNQVKGQSALMFCCDSSIRISRIHIGRKWYNKIRNTKTKKKTKKIWRPQCKLGLFSMFSRCCTYVCICRDTHHWCHVK